MSNIRPFPGVVKGCAIFWVLASLGCSSNPPANDSGTSGDTINPTDNPPPTDVPPAERCMAHTVTCQDEQIMRLQLFNNQNIGAVTAVSSEAGVFTSQIDATGGGMSPTRSYVYARFTDAGLEKVMISDEQALTSTDWDIAFRRFVIRVNSGVAGPSCVEVAPTPTGTTFAGFTTPPADSTFAVEDYYSDPPACTYMADTSGLESPATRTADFWRYDGCVRMTGRVYAIHLRNGRYVKLTVDGYYAQPAVQAMCNTSGMVPSPSGAGVMRIRWAFITR